VVNETMPMLDSVADSKREGGDEAPPPSIGLRICSVSRFLQFKCVELIICISDI